MPERYRNKCDICGMVFIKPQQEMAHMLDTGHMLKEPFINAIMEGLRDKNLNSGGMRRRGASAPAVSKLRLPRSGVDKRLHRHRP